MIPAQSSGTSQNLLGITFGTDRFVAVGSGRVIVESTDPVTWKKP